MSKTTRNKELAVILSCQLHLNMLSKSRRSLTDINSNIKYLTLENSYQFALGVLSFLEVQPTEYSIATLALVILHELDRSNLLIKVFLRPGLHKISSRITEHLRLDNYNSLNICLNYVYHFRLLIQFFKGSVQYGTVTPNVSLILVLSSTENDGRLTGLGNSSL